jgi:hypothetical protein
VVPTACEVPWIRAERPAHVIQRSTGTGDHLERRKPRRIRHFTTSEGRPRLPASRAKFLSQREGRCVILVGRLGSLPFSSMSPKKAHIMMALLCVAAVALLALRSARAAEVEPAKFLPRFALQFGYPQALAASAGTWIRLGGGPDYRVGGVGDVEVGLSGASIKLGPGAAAPESSSYEKVWSFGIQAALHRTWPWWSPWLPRSSTLGGGEIFAAYFAFRCSAGAMWPVSADSSPIFVGACGVGLP